MKTELYFPVRLLNSGKRNLIHRFFISAEKIRKDFRIGKTGIVNLQIVVCAFRDFRFEAIAAPGSEPRIPRSFAAVSSLLPRLQRAMPRKFTVDVNGDFSIRNAPGKRKMHPFFPFQGRFGENLMLLRCADAQFQMPAFRFDEIEVKRGTETPGFKQTPAFTVVHLPVRTKEKRDGSFPPVELRQLVEINSRHLVVCKPAHLKSLAVHAAGIAHRPGSGKSSDSDRLSRTVKQRRRSVKRRNHARFRRKQTARN